MITLRSEKPYVPTFMRDQVSSDSSIEWLGTEENDSFEKPLPQIETELKSGKDDEEDNK